eukprot:NODE_630_length_5791_cov_0.338370.p1 type:complete len:402 gc:universal NODE_630_length_5791_cov_0.338370:3968-2763(-)
MFKKRNRKAGNVQKKDIEEPLDTATSNPLIIKSKRRKIEAELPSKKKMEENIDDLIAQKEPDKKESDYEYDSHEDDQNSLTPVKFNNEHKFKMSSNYNNYIDIEDDSDIPLLRGQGIIVEEKEKDAISLDHFIQHLESLKIELDDDISTLELEIKQVEEEFEIKKAHVDYLSFSDEDFMNLQTMAARLNLLIPQKIPVSHLIELTNHKTSFLIKNKMNFALDSVKKYLHPTESIHIENEFNPDIESNKYFYHYSFVKKQCSEMPLLHQQEFRQVWEYFFVIEYCYTILFLQLDDISGLACMNKADVSWIPSELKNSTNLLFLIQPTRFPFMLDYLALVLSCVNYATKNANLDDFIDDLFILPKEWFKEEYYFTLEEIMAKIPSGHYSSSVLQGLDDGNDKM